MTPNTDPERYLHKMYFGNRLLDYRAGDGSLQKYVPKSAQRPSRTIVEKSTE